MQMDVQELFTLIDEEEGGQGSLIAARRRSRSAGATCLLKRCCWPAPALVCRSRRFTGWLPFTTLSA